MNRSKSSISTVCMDSISVSYGICTVTVIHDGAWWYSYSLDGITDANDVITVRYGACIIKREAPRTPTIVYVLSVVMIMICGYIAMPVNVA